MSEVNAPVWVFDPVMSFTKIKAERPSLEAWHKNVIITKNLREKLPYVYDMMEKSSLMVPGGVTMTVPVVRIGLQIGTIVIDEINALVVDGGYYDVVLGSEIFDHVFRVGQEEKTTGGVARSQLKERKTTRPCHSKSIRLNHLLRLEISIIFLDH